MKEPTQSKPAGLGAEAVITAALVNYHDGFNILTHINELQTEA